MADNSVLNLGLHQVVCGYKQGFNVKVVDTTPPEQTIVVALEAESAQGTMFVTCQIVHVWMLTGSTRPTNNSKLSQTNHHVTNCKHVPV